jgi:hypothetical protein
VEHSNHAAPGAAGGDASRWGVVRRLAPRTSLVSRILFLATACAATGGCDALALTYGESNAAPVTPPATTGTATDWKVDVGTGESEFAPLADGDTVAKQHGPQGGYHVWISLRIDGKVPDPVEVELTATQGDAIVSRATSIVSPRPEQAPSTAVTIPGLRAFVDVATTGNLLVVAKVIDPQTHAFAQGQRAMVLE